MTGDRLSVKDDSNAVGKMHYPRKRKKTGNVSKEKGFCVIDKMPKTT